MGRFSPPVISIFANQPTAGMTTAAAGQNTLGRVFSADARRRTPTAAYAATVKSAPRAASLSNSFSYPRRMMSTLRMVDSPSAASAAIT
jgi:hypothetical protein